MNYWVSKCGKVSVETRARGYNIVKWDGNIKVCDTQKEARAFARSLLAPPPVRHSAEEE